VDERRMRFPRNQFPEDVSFRFFSSSNSKNFLSLQKSAQQICNICVSYVHRFFRGIPSKPSNEDLQMILSFRWFLGARTVILVEGINEPPLNEPIYQPWTRANFIVHSVLRNREVRSFHSRTHSCCSFVKFDLWLNCPAQ